MTLETLKHKCEDEELGEYRVNNIVFDVVNKRHPYQETTNIQVYGFTWLCLLVALFSLVTPSHPTNHSSHPPLSLPTCLKEKSNLFQWNEFPLQYCFLGNDEQYFCLSIHITSQFNHMCLEREKFHLVNCWQRSRQQLSSRLRHSESPVNQFGNESSSFLVPGRL